MSIALGSYAFDPCSTSAAERHEETGGRDARVVEIQGVLDGLASEALVQAALDAVLAAASAEDPVALSLRAGRRLWVRRKSFERTVAADGLSASFVLTLEAEDPFEESDAETVVSWGVLASGAQYTLNTAGSAESKIRVALVASGTVVDPAFSDGVRSISYSGQVADGKTLLVDGPSDKVWLDGVDVTPYTSGEFLRVSPGGTVLTYADDASSSHQAELTVFYRDRWW